MDTNMTDSSPVDIDDLLLKLFAEDTDTSLKLPKDTIASIMVDLAMFASTNALELAFSEDPTDERSCLNTLCFAIWCYHQMILVRRKIKLRMREKAGSWTLEKYNDTVDYLEFLKDAKHVVSMILASATSRFLATTTGARTLSFIHDELPEEAVDFDNYLIQIADKGACPEDDLKVTARPSTAAFMLLISCSDTAECLDTVSGWEKPDKKDTMWCTYNAMAEYFEKWNASSPLFQEKIMHAVMTSIDIHLSNVPPSNLHMWTTRLMSKWDNIMEGDEDGRTNYGKFDDVSTAMAYYLKDLPGLAMI